jgi:hypothetical protein
MLWQDTNPRHKKTAALRAAVFLNHSDWVLKLSVLGVINILNIDFLVGIPGGTQYRQNITDIT